MNDNDFGMPDLAALGLEDDKGEFGLGSIKEVKKEVIKVFGIGGAGGNAVRNLATNYKSRMGNVEICALNTDAAALVTTKADKYLLLGRDTLHGKGAGSDIFVGLEATKDAKKSIETLLKDTDLLFITAGMGGGTGTLSSAEIARLAKEHKNIVTIAVVNTPFTFEGDRNEQAQYGIEELKRECNAYIVIDSNKLLLNKDIKGLPALFLEADRVLCESVVGITELITEEQVTNADFNDLKTTLSTGGRSVISTAYLEVDDDDSFDPEKFTKDIIDKALNNPLLNNGDIKGARKLLVHAAYTPDYSSYTLDIAKKIHEQTKTEDGRKVSLIPAFGDMKADQLIPGKVQGRICIIATGMEEVQPIEAKEEIPPVAETIGYKPNQPSFSQPVSPNISQPTNHSQVSTPTNNIYQPQYNSYAQQPSVQPQPTYSASQANPNVQAATYGQQVQNRHQSQPVNPVQSPTTSKVEEDIVVDTGNIRF